MGRRREFRLGLKKMKKMNIFLLLNALIIVVISILTIYSATIHKNSSFYKKELFWGVIGIFVYLFFSFVDYRKYAKYYKVLYIINIGILASVYVLGVKRLGAQRWIDLGPISIQPSEIGKVLAILTLSEFLVVKYRDRFVGLKSVIVAGLHILPIMLLILKQPDLGTTLILTMTFCVIIFMHGIDWKTIIIMGIGGIVSVPAAYFFLLKPYQRQRVLTFLNPEADLLGSGWNVTQSMIAIGSGGMYGSYNASYTETTRFRNNSYFNNDILCNYFYTWNRLENHNNYGNRRNCICASSIFFPFKTISKTESAYIFKSRG